jgi:hypothetical protein
MRDMCRASGLQVYSIYHLTKSTCPKFHSMIHRNIYTGDI